MRDTGGEHAEAHAILLKEAGFRGVGVRYLMSCPLDGSVTGVQVAEPGGRGKAAWIPVDNPESVADLAFECFRDSEDPVESHWGREEWHAWLLGTRKGARGVFLPEASETLVLDDRPAGFFLGTESNGALFLSDLGLLPEFRGRRLGHALIERFLVKGGLMGYKTSTLTVAAENTPAIALYDKHGYRRRFSLVIGEIG